MKFSARNVFRGKVKSLDKGPITTEVTIELHGGLEMVATVTTKSAENMELIEGAETTALIKASHVILMTEYEKVI